MITQLRWWIDSGIRSDRVPQICRWYHSNGIKWRGTKEPLFEGERGEWKSWLKTQHSKKTKIMASSSTTSRQIEGGKVEAVTNFLFLGFKITVDSDYIHKIKRNLLLARTAMINLNSVLRSRDQFPDKGLYSQSYGFSSSHVWMWEKDHKEGWTLRNWCFQIVVLEKTLESLWTAKSSNQSTLKEINPEYSLEKLMQKQKLQYFGHLMRRPNSLEKTLMLGKIEGRRRSRQKRIRWLLTQWTWIWANSGR